jgi:antitoxin HicB
MVNNCSSVCVWMETTPGNGAIPVRQPPRHPKKVRARVKSPGSARTYTYTATIEPAEEGAYFVQVPALPGCFTQGETWNEAVANAQEAIECYLESLAKHGDAIPVEPHGPRQVTALIQVKLALPV